MKRGPTQAQPQKAEATPEQPVPRPRPERRPRPARSRQPDGLLVKADGVISGGHDRATFTNRTNQLWPNGNRRFRVTPAVSATADIQKVQYTALDDAGGAGASGSKTLLDELADRKVALLADMNAAIWASIASCTFPGQLDGGGYNGTSDFTVSSAASSYKGYYNGGNQVDTMYPA